MSLAGPLTLSDSQGATEGLEHDLGISVLVKTFSPLPSTLSLRLSGTSTVSSIISAVLQKIPLARHLANDLRLTRLGGQTIERDATLASLASHQPISNAASIEPLVCLRIHAPVMGGKGGFGSMLRAQGGKMSSNRNGEENNDSCRDLNGRRLSTVKQARQLALYLGNQAEREKEISEAQKKKYAKLEKMLGRKPKGESDFVEAAQKLHESGGDLNDGEEVEEDRGEGSSRDHSMSTKIEARSEYKGKKRERINDTEYIEQSREIVDNVRSAVASAMMKKKKTNKKAKVSSSTVATKTESPIQQPSAQAVS